MLIYQDYEDRFPELATEDAARRAWIERRLNHYDKTLSDDFGSQKDEAVLLRVADEDALRTSRTSEYGRGIAGTISKVKVGKVEVQHGSGSKSSGPGDGSSGAVTDYRKQFDEILNSTIPPFGVF